MDCKEFDDQLVRPNGALLKLLRDYVCVRITDLTGVDVGLFEFDPDITIYGFVITADEQILLRYGGRDDASAESYLNEASLKAALEKGVELHEKYTAGEIAKVERPAALFPQDYPEIKNGALAKKQCVHCHMLGSGKTKLLQGQGKLDRLKDLWVNPDIKNLGVEIDPEKPLLVKDASDAAEKGGLKKKDEIIKLEGTPVYTFGDLQYQLNKHSFDATSLKLTVLRKDAEVEVEIKLEKWWRSTDISRRSTTHALEPFAEFWGKELDKAAKTKLGLKEEEWGLEVTKFWVKTNAQAAGVQVGDIVYAVDDNTTSEYTSNPTTWIRLNKNAGDTITVKVWRGGKKLEFSFKLKARPW